MHRTKRALVLAVAVMMILGAVALFAACINTSALNWRDYVMDEDELTEFLGGSKLPEITCLNYDETTRVNIIRRKQGVIIIDDGNKIYGYSIVSGKSFGEKDDLKYLQYEFTNIVWGRKQNGDNIIYDITGRTVATGATVEFYDTSVDVSNHESKSYVRFVVNDGKPFYLEILDDGSLSTTKLIKLPDGIEDYLLNDDAQPIGDWLEIEEQEDDKLLDYTYVGDSADLATFYDSTGKEISVWTKPTDLDAFVYADGNIIYSTRTQAYNDDNYNYVDEYGINFLAKLFSFNIKSGKTKELNADYMLTGGESLYNKTKKTYDKAELKVCRMTDGIAHGDDIDTVIINAEGAVCFSLKDSKYGRPIAKIGKNYLTVDDDSNYKIADSRGNVLTTLGKADEVVAVIPKALVVEKDGKIGTVGFNGKQKIDFKYNAIDRCRVFGDYVIVSDDDGKRYSLNLTTGVATSLTAMTNVSEDSIYIEFLGRYETADYTLVYTRDDKDGTYDWYTIDGKLIIADTRDDYLPMYERFDIYEKSYGWARVNISTGSAFQSTYICFSF